MAHFRFIICSKFNRSGSKSRKHNFGRSWTSRRRHSRRRETAEDLTSFRAVMCCSPLSEGKRSFTDCGGVWFWFFVVFRFVVFFFICFYLNIFSLNSQWVSLRQIHCMSGKIPLTSLRENSLWYTLHYAHKAIILEPLFENTGSSTASRIDKQAWSVFTEDHINTLLTHPSNKHFSQIPAIHSISYFISTYICLWAGLPYIYTNWLKMWSNQAV